MGKSLSELRTNKTNLENQISDYKSELSKLEGNKSTLETVVAELDACMDEIDLLCNDSTVLKEGISSKDWKGNLWNTWDGSLYVIFSDTVSKLRSHIAIDRDAAQDKIYYLEEDIEDLKATIRSLEGQLNDCISSINNIYNFTTSFAEKSGNTTLNIMATVGRKTF